MANPLFNALGGGMPAMPNPMGQFGQMMQQFQQFKANFQGDPKAEVQKLLQSGKMSKPAEPAAGDGAAVSAVPPLSCNRGHGSSIKII